MTGRVRIKKILNPDVFRPATTYLEAEVEDLVDIDAEERVALKTITSLNKEARLLESHFS